MKKYPLLLVGIVCILLFFKPARAQMVPFAWSWGLPSPFFSLTSARFSNPAPYPPLLPSSPFPTGMPLLQPPLPLLLKPQISIPSPISRMAAATITIFSAPTLSAIQVTALPTTTVVPVATSTTPTSATTTYTFILPALLTIPTTPYTQTQTASITSIFPAVSLVGVSSTAILPGLAAGLTPVPAI
ncbi:MAG: hypothetical protein AB1847_03860 [bacterium]